LHPACAFGVFLVKASVKSSLLVDPLPNNEVREEKEDKTMCHRNARNRWKLKIFMRQIRQSPYVWGIETRTSRSNDNAQALVRNMPVNGETISVYRVRVNLSVC